MDNFNALYPEYIYVSIITGIKPPSVKVQGEVRTLVHLTQKGMRWVFIYQIWLLRLWISITILRSQQFVVPIHCYMSNRMHSPIIKILQLRLKCCALAFDYSIRYNSQDYSWHYITIHYRAQFDSSFLCLMWVCREVCLNYKYSLYWPAESRLAAHYIALDLMTLLPNFATYYYIIVVATGRGGGRCQVNNYVFSKQRFCWCRELMW
jgi:hypothetical protein